MRAFMFAALIVVVAIANPVFAGPLDARIILQRMKAALEPERPSTRTIVLAVHASDGSTIEWTARQARKHIADGNGILTVILEPDDLKGVGLLIREHKDHPDEQWMYLPSIRRVRKIVPVGAYESFLGTDFTLADLGFVNLRDEKLSRQGDETIAGKSAYRVQEVLAGPRVYYSRIITVVAKDTMLPVRRDYYDAAKELWKMELYPEPAVVDGVPTVLRIDMEDRLQRTRTELRVSQVRYDAAVPDELFEPEKLPDASKHPLWVPSSP